MNRILFSLAAIAAAATMSACFSPASVTCGDDGPTCPEGWRCTADNKFCINPEVTLCGDGVQDEGELCDDGNLDSHDGCNWDCTLPRCGDGFVDEGEVCDDGGTNINDGCSTDCQSLEVCGDGYRNNYPINYDGTERPAEECDEGDVDTATCNADCTTAVCGDGKTNTPAGEQCDGGSPTVRQPTDTVECNRDCSFTACGDEYVNAAASEQCDNGRYCADGTPCTAPSQCAGILGDTDCITRDFECCTRNCQNPLCGNGVLEPQCEGFPLEVCDDGRHCEDLSECITNTQCAGIGDGQCITRRATGCRQDCLSAEICGDGIVNNYAPYNELCDDGRHCADLTTECTLNSECDGIGDGVCRVRNGTGCSADCASLETCGDEYINDYPGVNTQGEPVTAEVCDDGRFCDDGDASGAGRTKCTSVADCGGAGDGLCRARNSDGCSNDCRSLETCGDRIVNSYNHPVVNNSATCVPMNEATCPFPGLATVGQPFVGREACDDGNNVDGDRCSSDCLSEEECGDGYLNDYPPFNEICDDGNNSDGDGCAANCRSTEDCGNGVTDPGEECDDGILNGTDQSPNGCSATCRFVQCGNARKDPGEECDEAIPDPGDPSGETLISINDDEARCKANCICNVCGDGNVNGTTGATTDCPISRFEECDAGGVNTAACNFNCTQPECGDKIINFVAGELCDTGSDNGAPSGQTDETAACNTDCSLASCGDGKLNRARGEVCDDGNNTNGDGCSADCKSEEICGDKILNPYVTTPEFGASRPAEVCDDGRHCDDLTTQCTSDADCADIGDATCALRDGTGCSFDCLSAEICGDSYLNFDETCDDGDDLAGDGCNEDCLTETGWACETLGDDCFEICGDSLVVGKETCDDGAHCDDGTPCTENSECAGIGDEVCVTRQGDGCNATCAIEAGWDCPTDGGTGLDGGACAPVCGDLRIRPGETCDDGNDDAGDGCSDSCQTETGWSCAGTLNGLGGICTPICGDNITRGAEQCDDGLPVAAGDGCDTSCKAELGWDCPVGGGDCDAVCGDFVIRGAEQCDDGNEDAGDGCDDQCQREAGFACPIGFTVTVGGECVAICGDGLVRGAEACDDDGTASGDGCDSGCQPETGWDCPFNAGVGGTCTPTCGDNRIRGNETCDEGANAPSGGCVSCQAQAGWSCPTSLAMGGLCTSNCGDDMVVGDEECDDGAANSDNADCTSQCATATCDDDLQHSSGTGSETDVDCGGDDCDPCDVGGACLDDGDCASNYCAPLGGVCEVAPTPVLGDDALTMLETDADLVIDVALELLGNDTGHDPDSLTADATSDCNGTVTVSVDLSAITYVPPADPSACATDHQDTFDYTLCSPNDGAICSSATVTITINREPTVADAFSCVPVSTPTASLDVATIFTDPDPGDALSNASIVATSAGAGATSRSGSVVTWTPTTAATAASYGVDIEACDGSPSQGCDEGTWTVVWNDPPTLNDIDGDDTVDVIVTETAAVPLEEDPGSVITDFGAVEGVPAGGEPIASVTVGAFPSGPFAPSITTARGSCMVDLVEGEIVYTAGATPGADSCFVRVCEACSGGNVCSVARVAFDLIRAPVAVDDTVNALEGPPATGNFSVTALLANDTDVDAATFTLENAGATSCGGTVVRTGDDLAYTGPGSPAGGCLTDDTFTYEVCSPALGDRCDSATVTIAINRNPVLDDTYTCVPVGSTRTTLDAQPLFSDPDGDGVGSVAATGPDGLATVQGTTVTWAPDNRDLARTYAVALTACDDAEAPGCDMATWTAAWNDDPTLTALVDGDARVVSQLDSTSVEFEDFITDLGVEGVAPGGDPIDTVTIVAPFPANGSCTVDMNNELVTYTAGADVGSNTCHVQVCEVCSGGAVCSTTQLEFTVIESAGAVDDQVTILDGTPGTGTFAIADLTANDSAIDPNSFDLVSATTTCGGSVTEDGTDVSYTAPSDPSLCTVPYVDTFDYEVCNPLILVDCDIATVTVTINRAPTVADAFACYPQNTANASIDVDSLFTDPDGDGLDDASIQTVDTGAGTSSTLGSVVTWTPTSPSAASAYSVDIEACDDSDAPGCDTGTWSLVWNDPPVLGTFTGEDNVTLAISTTAALDVDGVIILSTGAVTGVAAGDPIASVLVSDLVAGTYATTATTTLGTCEVVGDEVHFTAGASTGSDACFVQVCETCTGSAPVCAVTELQLEIVTCVGDSDCAGNQQATTCDLTTNECVGCTGNGHCTGNPSGEICGAGTPNICGCNGDGDCPSGVCDLGASTCVACFDDAAEGLEDTGCDAPTPACDDTGTPVCVACEGDGDCTGDDVCDTDTNTCVECNVDLDCTGNPAGEACDADTNTCVACNVDGDCTGNPAGEACDADTNTCVECNVDGDCTGNPAGEACDAATNTCAECNIDDDCTGNPAGEACDVGTATCVECVGDGDCVDHANGSSCKLATNTCGCDDGTECEDTGATGPFCGDTSVCVDAWDIGYCVLQFPATLSLETEATEDVYGRVFIAGLTDVSSGTGDADPYGLVRGVVGYGPTGSDPSVDDTGWVWTAVGTLNAPGGDGNNDEYVSVLTAPSTAGTHDYAFRFSGDGGMTWTHCDLDGVVPGGGGPTDGYDDEQSGVLTVTAPPPLIDEDFDALPMSSPSESAFTTALPEWAFTATATYQAGPGTGTTGGFYSYGAASTPERALGSLPSTGSGDLYFGACFENTTGDPMELTMTYTGEQWRDGGNTTPQSLVFAFTKSITDPAGLGAALATAPTGDPATGWTNQPALNFTGPKATSTAGALDGNAPANQVQRGHTFGGLVLAPTEVFCFRWFDANDTGNDHGLAVDDLLLTGGPPPGP